jgi:hypothetical protein
MTPSAASRAFACVLSVLASAFLTLGTLPSAPPATAAALPPRAAPPVSVLPRPLLASSPAATKVTLGIKGFNGTHFTANIGDKVPLVAKAGQVPSGDHLVIDRVARTPKPIQSCTRKTCTRSAHYSTAGQRQFEAILTGPSGVVAQSNTIAINWRDLTLTVKASDTYGSFNAATGTQLAGVAVHVAATTPSGAVGSLWTRIEIVDEGGAVKATCTTLSDCGFDALEYAGTRTSTLTSVTHTYHAVALGSGGTLAQSAPVSITWRPWSVTLSGGGILGKTEHGSVTVQVERPVTAPNLTLVVVDLNGGASDAQACAGAQCTLDITPRSGTHLFEAIVVNPTTNDVAGASSTATYRWCPAGEHNGTCDSVNLQLTADKDQLPVGGTVTLTATSQNDLSGTGYHIVISSDGGATNDCPAEQSSCSWSVKETSPVKRTFTATLVPSDGSSPGATSNSVEVEWKAYVIVSLTPPSQTVTAGKPATLTAESNLALLPGYSIKLFEDNGNESSPCTNEAGSCTFQATESIPGKHTFHAEILDDHGNRVDTGGDVTAEVEWVAAWKGTITISVDNNYTQVPVSVKARVRAIASPTLSGTGYQINIVSSAGGGWHCQDTSDNCYIDDTSLTATTRTYRAYVADTEGGHAADSATGVTVTWTLWSVSLQLDPTFTPVPFNGSVNAPVLPVKAPFSLEVATAGFNIDGTGLHFVETELGGSSNAPTTGTSTPDEITYESGWSVPGQATEEAVIEDASGNVVSNQATLVVTGEDWNLRGYWDNATQAANYNLAPGISATLTAASDFEVAGTGYFIAIFGTSNQTPDNRCRQTTGCRETYTGQAGESVSPVLGVYDPTGNPLTPAVPVQEVTWGSTGGGGVGCGGVTLTDISANPTNPSAGESVTLTAYASGTIPDGCKIVFGDSPQPGGYIYDQCVGSSYGSQCSTTVPTGDPNSCAGSGAAGTSCTFIAFIAVAGGNNAPLSQVSVDVTWSSAAASEVLSRPPDLRSSLAVAGVRPGQRAGTAVADRMRWRRIHWM